MDRDAIMGAMPSGDEFQAAPEYGKKKIVEDFIGTILDALNQEGREPDRWEAEHIASTLGLVLVGWYHAATVKAELTLTPSDERANPETWVRGDDTATARALRDGLERVSGVPARNF
ncbi:hypothetical protein [Paraburkholderia hospita]|uniref:Uncharacterized protein n=1 Tax=Paraburkholderia hospita TaxID=169430 RepID=A0AAN1JHC0_9BURK|nr:hypothetical protein [Paraburkholderia hospita]AUT74038.1 hypothetical protein C2L64_37715 [Paraburkholderia hospita]EIN02948.1 hypothetical protein WQE_00960 [Paraburkholderia hospita]OUL78692.1 hypothetical protein CA602_31100 [Paraburkholderia hospita]OUL85897.1 hypothetical protein CA601_23095 [Paraburkholderia hospita]SEH45521.1 hypothetical protein SAMN05192544_100247 [Paraburkholderia hospita]